MKPLALYRLTWMALAMPLALFAVDPPTTEVSPNLLPPAPPAPLQRPVRVFTNQSGTVMTNVVRPLAPRTNSSRPVINSLSVPPAVTATVDNPGALKWDAVVKEYQAKAGETEAKFTFSLTNTSKADVTISSVHTSCGCTVAKLPHQPWVVAPGENGEIGVTVDLRGKFGAITKTATVSSTAGQIPLMVKITIPSPSAADRNMGNRSRNLQIAAADRQAVFRGDCATCHVAPTVGKTGKALFDTACGICHDGQNRASMVPDLRALNKPTDHSYWMQWITAGREGSLMPAFALSKHGILNDDQIKSLADYLDGEFRLELNLPGGIHAAPPAVQAQPIVAPKP